MTGPKPNGKLTNADKKTLSRLSAKKREELEIRETPLPSPIASTVGPIGERFRQMIENQTPEERQRRADALASKKEQARRAEIVRALGILKSDCGERLCPFKRATLQRFELYDPRQDAVLQRVRDYVADIERNVAEGNGVFLIGPPGTGKDHIAVAIAREAVVRCGVSARWLDCATFRASVRDGMKSSGREVRAVSAYVDAGVLILSDPVSAGSALTDFQAETLFRIVDGRYRACRPTFVTANLENNDDAEKTIGTQTVDRLSHGGLRLRFNWESFRTKGK